MKRTLQGFSNDYYKSQNQKIYKNGAKPSFSKNYTDKLNIKSRSFVMLCGKRQDCSKTRSIFFMQKRIFNL